MPRFEVVGIGRETGRKRVNIYNAADKEAAIAIASAEGTIVEVDKIRQLPEMPATDAQKEYAKSLEIEFPPDIGKIEISQLINAKLKEQDEQLPAYEDALTIASISEIMRELDNRNLGAVLVTFDIDKIDFKNFSGNTEFSTSWTDNITEDKMKMILIGMGYHYAKAIEKLQK